MCIRDRFEGKGKPEPLKHNLSGFWSRRIIEEHRLVYAVTDDSLLKMCIRDSHQVVRAFEIRLRETLCSKTILISDHHQLVARFLQPQQDVYKRQG